MFAVLLACILSLASICSPSEPGCPFAEDCADDESRICINYCIPEFEGDILDDSVLCALDECDESLLTTPALDIWRCPRGDAAGEQFTCVPFAGSPYPDRVGRCQPANAIAESCDPSASGTCESTTFCLDVAACPAQTADRHLLGVPADAAGYCWLPQREGERCDSDLSDDEVGCLACEWGTRCVDTRTGPRCLRTCVSEADPTVARPELCDCEDGEAACQDHATAYAPAAPGDHPVSAGDPQFYCTPPAIPDNGRCDANDEGRGCAEEGSICQPGTDGRSGLPADICCPERPLTSCTSDADCCNGVSVCQAGSCLPCSRHGEEMNLIGCCPSTTPVEGVCRSCASDPMGREGRVFGGDSCDGDFLLIGGPENLEAVLAVPGHGNTGAGPNELGAVSGSMRWIRYLAPDHHVFLFEGDLTGHWPDRTPPGDPPDFVPTSTTSWPPAGVLPGHRWMQLPSSTDGGLAPSYYFGTSGSTAEPPANTWRSVRTYHGGTCSRLVTWQTVVDAITAALNKFLADPQWGMLGSDPLTLMDATVTPILHSGSGSPGSSTDDDQVNLFVQYQALTGEAFGCPGGIVRLNVGLRLRRRPATQPTFDGELHDDDYLGTPHECSDDLVAHLEDRLGEGVTDCVEACIHPDHRYICTVNMRVRGEPFTVIDPRERFTRKIIGAYDFVPELVFVGGGLDTGCAHSALNHFLRETLRGVIEREMSNQLDRLISGGSRNLPDATLGLAFDDLPACGRTHPVTGDLIPSNAMCTDDFTIFGTRRHECVGYDDMQRMSNDRDAIVEYRCGRYRPEVRRVNVRPDGLEVVLANSADDPQFPGIQAAFPARCGPMRPAAVAPGAPPVFGTMAAPRTRLRTLLPAPGARRICSPDDLVDGTTTLAAGCAGFCPDVGLPCGLIFRTAGALGDACYVGPYGDDRGRAVCCQPTSMCPIPAASGGRQYTGVEGAPTPVDVLQCVDLMTSPLACGGCGVACAVGQTCVAGACVSP